MKSLGFILALGLASVACGDNQATPDAPVVIPKDAPVDTTMIDAPVVAATLTTYVIDLVKNHTDNGPSRAFTEFSTLPDPDGTSNNGNGTQGVYNTLFP